MYSKRVSGGTKHSRQSLAAHLVCCLNLLQRGGTKELEQFWIVDRISVRIVADRFAQKFSDQQVNGPALSKNESHQSACTRNIVDMLRLLFGQYCQ